jgi:hypothetical protein
LTIEPLLAFDLGLFLTIIKNIGPEKVWLGINSREKFVTLPEPSEAEFLALLAGIESSGITVKLKTTFETRKEKSCR